MEGTMTHKALGTILLFALVLIGGCSGPSGPIRDIPKAEAFIGTWINEDENTGGITKVVIRTDTSTIFVHMWGKCIPIDCDWREETTTIEDADDNQLSLEWNQGFVIITQVLHYLDDGRLKVDSHAHYIDDSGRPDSDFTEYFAKE
jgi:hypothetical protein